MNVCRTCLTASVDKDINLLSEELEGESRTSNSDIMLFCLGIQVIPESNITSKLCEECFFNILSFHKFKTLAVKSDEYLQSLQEKEEKKDVIVENNIKQEDTVDFFHDDDDDMQEDTDVKQELDVNDEDSLMDLQSDDELLSVIKKIKYEYVTTESKENEPKKANKKKKLKRKRNRDVENPERICVECGKTVCNLKDHMLQHQPLLMRKRYKCKDCDKLFSTYNSRSRHYKTKHLGIKKHCDECNKDYVNLISHQKLVHKSALLPYECVPCGRRFISPSVRDEHMLTHTKERPYACDQCDKAFRSKIVLRHHKRQVHDKEKTHLCQFCSKRFFKKYHLQVHIRSHLKEKPYECPECGKFFSSTTTLKNHKLLHTNVKMFACQLCDMTFITSGYLRNHMVCHSKERRHPCQYCGVAFRRSDHRRRHERTAHEKHILPAA